jgi:glyoxylase-like metal-dependent hydrolase (beta-lactamase superfamily II)
MDIEAFFDERTFTLTYVVSDPNTKDALVIDPVLDYDPLPSQTFTESVDAVTKFIEDHGLTLRYVLETHAHADHLSGSQLLKRRFDAKVAIGERITKVQGMFKDIFDLPNEFKVDGSQFDRLLADDEEFEAGSLKVKVIPTPGHTPACSSYLIGDAVFTGDALFMEDYGTGRCDFPGGDAEAMYHSVHERLYKLPDATRVFVGHDYLPGGRELRYESTIGTEKKQNKQLRQETTREEFVNFRKERDSGLKQPRLIFQSVQVNVDAGRLPPPHDNGRRYLVLPLNMKQPTDETGEPR